MISSVISWFEKQAFGVCTYLGNKLGIKSNTVRMYFIYLSFFTAGSPIILYFVFAFMLENKNHFKPFKSKRTSVWDL